MDRGFSRRSVVLIGLAAYFCAHALLRGFISPALNFDESEQSFLSQSMAWGYNSQPPLYTWIQTVFFEVLGCNAFAMALMKNGFLLLTYWLLFKAIEEVTESVPLAIVGSLGMFTIPQIAWESHRDLSHTVAATCMTCALFYCIVRMASQKFVKPWVGYVCLGLIVAAGIMFKYNFGIVVVGFLIAGLTIAEYRSLLLNNRMLLSVATAAAILTPHVLWVLNHATIASRKTLQTLTGDRSESWFDNMWSGSQAFAISAVACCGLTLFVFAALYVRKNNSIPEPTMKIRSAMLLIERFLIVVVAILFMLVLSGHAIEFKNRWFQPFVCLLPAYLVLRFGGHVLARPRMQKLAQVMTVAIMFVLLAAMTVRPLAGQWRGKYCWLNMPYDQLAIEIESHLETTPQIVVTPDMRLGGNLRVFMPDSMIMSHDTESSLPEDPAGATGVVVLVTESQVDDERNSFLEQVATDVDGVDLEEPWVRVELPMRYSSDGATAIYHFRVLHATPAARVAERTRNAH
ncbi:MAG TPA: hypothetical protein DEF45_25105 [Rhodopirellula sp.]|nr:MAG: hypothetical protein CBD74_07160 [Saprospirales bacterium TMED214]HBV66296.1 hypothetical protein [Rhodopirellula sp.]